MLSWLLTTLATGIFDFYSLAYSLISILEILLVFCLLALLTVAITRLTKAYIFKPLTYHFDHWGVHLEGENYSGSVAWNKITKTESKVDAFILFENNIPSITISKKDFESNEQLNALQRLLEEKGRLKVV